MAAVTSDWLASAPVADNPQAAACGHCGLPVPSELVVAGEAEQFCCAGCKTVHALIRDAGLDGYYAFRERLGEAGQPATVSEQRYQEMDVAAFHDLYSQAQPEGLFASELSLHGVHCAACVWLVEKLPNLVSGVHEARLDLSRGVVRIVWDPAVTRLSEAACALDQLGYRPAPARGASASQRRRETLRSLLVRLGVAGASAGNTMLLAFALYSGAFGERMTMSLTERRFFELLSLVVSLPALWAAGIIFRGAWAAIRTRTPHMDVPLALGIAVAFGWGTLNALAGRSTLYFDSITTLVFLLLVGRYVQTRQQLGASDAAELVHAVTPAFARVVEDSGAVIAKTTATVERGQLVEVLGGELVPVDGVIESGESFLDCSLLSGESRPVKVGPGEDVPAGSLNLSSVLRVRTLRVGAESRIGAIAREVERALSDRSPLAGTANRLAGIFTQVVLALSLGTFLYWVRIDTHSAVENALSLLIVACPCALGLATPLALSAAIARAAREKILIKGGDAIEQLGKPALVILDKTGTLTEGELRLLDYVGEASLRGAILRAEMESTHPIARALTRDLSADAPAELKDIRNHLGGGVAAELVGQQLFIGSERFVVGQGCELPADLASAARASERRGMTPVYVALGGRVRAILFLGDRIRSDAAESLALLRRGGHRLCILSGDDPRVAEAAAEALREAAGRSDLFERVVGGVTPEQKLAFVRDEVAKGTQGVVMVGDGVNDAGALASASVGVAVRGAAEASLLSAGVFLARPGLEGLAHLMTGSLRTLRTIRRGIALSLVYNAVGVLLAATGHLNPLIAAVLMPFSSLTVVTNAYRSRTFGTRTKERTK
jgi:Cu2+-exporting ATPase